MRQPDQNLKRGLFVQYVKSLSTGLNSTRIFTNDVRDTTSFCTIANDSLEASQMPVVPACASIFDAEWTSGEVGSKRSTPTNILIPLPPELPRADDLFSDWRRYLYLVNSGLTLAVLGAWAERHDFSLVAWLFSWPGMKPATRAYKRGRLLYLWLLYVVLHMVHARTIISVATILAEDGYLERCLHEAVSRTVPITLLVAG